MSTVIDLEIDKVAPPKLRGTETPRQLVEVLMKQQAYIEAQARDLKKLRDIVEQNT